MKKNNRGKANNREKAKMKETSTNNVFGKAKKTSESFAKKKDDGNAHHSFMPEYVYLWFTVFIVNWLKKSLVFLLFFCW